MLGSVSLKKLFFAILLLAISFCVLTNRKNIKALVQPDQNQEKFVTETVRRLPLETVVNAPGEMQSSNNTVVECEIERLSVVVQGRSITSGGSTRILKIIPDGSKVKKNDVLCVLDSSEFEEMARLQRINVERAKADHLEAEMNLEVAKIALDEYRQGTAKQQIQSLKGLIALAQTDSFRLTGRLDWSRKMLDKGYLSKNAVRMEELALQRADLQLTQSQIALNTFEKYSQPKVEHSLQVRIQSLTRVLMYENSRLERHRDRLKNYEKQIEKCTVRAPNDGIAVYANEDDGDTRVEEGSEVRQGQDLFYLPDLEHMQVMARLSESVVEKVKPGMKVKILVEALSGRVFDGHVERIAQFPIPPSSWRAAQEVKNYYCLVIVDNPTSDLRPGLNSEIRVLTEDGIEKLVVSPEVVQVEGDLSFCFVQLPDGEFEKRQIKSRTSDPETLEVLAGLKEGEEVIRQPRRHLELNTHVKSVVMLDESADSENSEESLTAWQDHLEQAPSTAAKWPSTDSVKGH